MTGVCWALLCAHARTLPAGADRRKLEAACREGQPSKMGAGLAVTVCERAGLLDRAGQLTPAGERGALRFLALKGLPLPRPDVRP